MNPLIQLFKPVSPLAWLPLVTMVVSAVYVTQDPMFSKSFITSMLTVLLCCLWPTIINTAVGVAGISKDLVNVSKVLRLSWWTHIFKIVLPSSIPMMFTGLRLSLGIAWMVLIAAEMLAQNPGLGKFVWDEFQNGSSNSLGRIMVAASSGEVSVDEHHRAIGEPDEVALTVARVIRSGLEPQHHLDAIPLEYHFPAP